MGMEEYLHEFQDHIGSYLQYILENIVDRFVFPSQFWFVAARGEDRSQHGVLRHCIAGVAPGRCAKQCPECEKL